MISESRMMNYITILQAGKELQWQGYDGGLCVCDCWGGAVDMPEGPGRA